MTPTKYFSGDTLTIIGGRTVTVRKVITNRLLYVSYGLDSNGNDMAGLIDTTIHLQNNTDAFPAIGIRLNKLSN